MAIARMSKMLGFVSTLLVAVSAIRLDEIARRGGYNEQTLKDWELRLRGLDHGNASSSKRYYSDQTKDYFVKSLPEIPQNFMTEMYSGLIPIDENDPSRALFFVFQPRIGDPVDEITIWLNGGPGCSSLEGFFQENGYINWGWGQHAPEINPYGWPTLSNILWVEQPVGTGFSIGTPNATNEEDIAADFVKFFKNFETLFGIENYQIYVTGESYAGRYVPYISNAMLEEQDECYFNLSGALMYDPCIGKFDYQNEVYTLPFIEHNNNILGYNKSYLAHLAQADEACGYAEYRRDWMQFPPVEHQPPQYPDNSTAEECGLWESAYNEAYRVNPCFNVYEPNLQCPLLSDPLGFPTDLQFVSPGLPVYFNRTDVKKAMHAPMNVTWSECNGGVFLADDGNGGGPGSGGPEAYGDTSPDPIQGVLPKVIAATNRVLVANGDLDMEILTNATMLAIQNMTWNGKLGFQKRPSKPIVIDLPDLMYNATFVANGDEGMDEPQGTMGVQHYERGLMWAETYLSGHMQPQFQPRSTYRHLQWLLRRIETL
ncbi:hypothetical protein LTR56_021250 [Elasticomyces elasticus]|nr:hypothetical protein LTR56_021250 [Elasticomyces elasticus]KAK3663580.1 hypothetical protein LTR22_005520 [Elasticomyces elasticus]KAK4923552.1 hypothetical protein LTR49_009265 [Elasticomyces elasticus]KAK5751566.1 hypothetical protein LTS12_018339 [Elasticomyces elasticus]